MSKGVFASVAALATSAGVAFGQGAPPAAPQAVPSWGGPPAQMSAPAGSMPGANGFLPNATEMPQSGVVGGSPQAYPGFETTFGGDRGQGYDAANCQNPQLHKAAGGPDHCWVDIESLGWRVRSMPIPFPLAVSSPPAAQGILGQEGTRVIFGNDNMNYGNYFNGLRLSGGWFWGADRTWGFEMSGFVLEARSEVGTFYAPIDGRQVLARPLIDALTGQASAVLVGFPGQFAGDMFINSRLKLGGAEANFVRAMKYCDTFKFNLIAGVRYIDHDETLYVTSRSTIPGAVPLDPTFVDIYDEFACRNQFFGGQAGFEMELRHRRFFCDITGKIALGNQHEELLVRGFTNTQVGGITTIVPYGMLALAGNTGIFNTNEFAYVPEATVKLGYQWTQRLSTYVGYNMLYISRLMRPGDQIDPVVNPVFLPVSQFYGGDFGPVRPINSFNKSDFWTQGVTFGMSLRF